MDGNEFYLALYVYIGFQLIDGRTDLSIQWRAIMVVLWPLALLICLAADFFEVLLGK